MKIDRMRAGMVVFDVGRSKLGNTTMMPVSVWRVHISSADLDGRRVEASWIGNAPRWFSERQKSGWREKAPLLVKIGYGYRLATSAELKAAGRAS